MKQLKCEMCGGIDLIKQDGVFVCQSCGCKYSVEEAKKMMIEGPVDVQGTVKVDNSDFVEKYLANARRAIEKEDWAEVEKYYNMVEQNDPSNIEAFFYSAYGKAMASMFVNDLLYRKQVCNVFCNCISIVDDNYNIENSDENLKIILQMNRDLFRMYNSSFVYVKGFQPYVGTVDNSNETYYLFAQMSFAFIESLTNIIKVDDKLDYWKLIYQHYKYLAENKGLTREARNINKDKAVFIGKRIQEKDTLFVPDEETSGGCYIATCVYGSYDCPQVWILRRYRDNTLASTWYGRAFIHTYYAISPTIVKWFGNTQWFKKLWKSSLDKMVSKMHAKGLENTPYQDKKWR